MDKEAGNEPVVRMETVGGSRGKKMDKGHTWLLMRECRAKGLKVSLMRRDGVSDRKSQRGGLVMKGCKCSR